MIQISMQLLFILCSCAPSKNVDTATTQEDIDVAPPFSCPTGAEQPSLGNIQNPNITETSGIGQSRRDPSILWMHNDSGDEAVLYATRITGESIGSFTVNTPALDWEDMSTIQLQDAQPYIYVGDIGDNAQARANISIHRIIEPENMDDQPSSVTYTVSYPDGPHNAETLVAHPITGTVYILTKDVNKTQIFALNEEEETLEEVFQFSFPEYEMEGSPLVTGGDISPDGSTLILRTYTHVWALDAAILKGSEMMEACAMPGAPEEQGEAITFLDDGHYITISEGTNPTIHRFSYTQE